MARTKTDSIDNLGGGVNDLYSTDDIFPSETPNTARNIRIDGNKKKQRKGYITIADTLTGGQGIQGLGEFRTSDTTPNRLASVHNGSLYTFIPDEDTAWTGLSIDDINPTGEVNFISQNGELFILDGVNQIKRIAKSTSTVFSNAIDGTTQNMGSEDLLAQKFTVATGSGIRLTQIRLALSADTVSTQFIVQVYNWAGGAPTTKVADFGDTVYVNESTNTYKAFDELELADGDYAVVVYRPPYSSSDGDVSYSTANTNPAQLNTGAGWVAQTNEMYTEVYGESIALVANEDITQPDAIAAAADFTPSFGISAKGSLWVGGVEEKRNVIFLAQAGTLADPEKGYDFSGTLSGASNADAFLLDSDATAVRKMGDTIVMFDDTSAYFAYLNSDATWTTRPLAGSQGAVNFRATVNVENDVYYLTPQNEIKSVRRATAENISAVVNPMSIKINKFLKSLDKDQKEAWAIYDQTEKLVKFYMKSEGSSYTDICVVGDIKAVDQYGQIPWTIDANKPFGCGTFFEDKSYAGSSFIGQVYQDEIGLADDDDAAISTFFSTKDITAGNPIKYKRFQSAQIHGELTRSTEINVKIYVDDVLVKEGVISGEDVFSGVDAGIGAFEVGEEEIGTGGDLDPSEPKDFERRFSFRATGKKMRIDLSTNDINQDYKISHIDYRIVTISKLYAPIGEKV